MAKTSGEFEKEFIDNSKTLTGKSVEEWLTLVKSFGSEKRLEILDWLKKEQGLNHMQAQFVIGIYFNNGNPVYINENVLLENQFLKCQEIRPLFEFVSDKIINAVPGTQLIPKKTYLSFTSDREFAAINIKPKELRLGLDLGEVPFDEYIQKSKLTGPMPRISHMVILTELQQFNHKLLDLLQQSYQRTAKK
ncbi:MAG: DUF4287 domain-containing protein [Saprospiraceae bacterium]|nr:DUF4287 domain-containing protein [Saprospiraceae bacterium]